MGRREKRQQWQGVQILLTVTDVLCYILTHVENEKAITPDTGPSECFCLLPVPTNSCGKPF